MHYTIYIYIYKYTFKIKNIPGLRFNPEAVPLLASSGAPMWTALHCHSSAMAMRSSNWAYLGSPKIIWI